MIWSEQNEEETYNVQIAVSLQYTAIVFTLFISTFFCSCLLKDQRQELLRLMTKVNETSQPGSGYAARVSLLDAAISLVRHNYCLLSIYTLHNAAPCLAIAGHLSVQGPGPGFNARSMQIISSYGARARHGSPGH